MKRRGRNGFVPHADDAYTVGPLIEFAPEHDATGNAANPAPLVEVVWGGEAARAGVVELGPEHDRAGNASPPAPPG